MDFDQEITQSLSKRIAVLYFFIILTYLIVFLRLWDLQVLKGDYFFELSENNRIKIQQIPAQRGYIYDRFGNILANNVPSFDVSVLCQGENDFKKVISPLSKILNIPGEEILNKIKQFNYLPSFKPIKIKEDVSPKELSLIEFYKLDLPNVLVEVFPKRNYPLGKSAAHILGYLGEIDESELKTFNSSNYNLGDFVGKSGVERVFEKELKGKPGWSYFEVDALGRKKAVLRSVNSLPGGNVYLTIDSSLQSFADKALGEKAGVIIAMDPNNGEILAFVSHPSFNPNLFSRGISFQNWGDLIKDHSHPLANRGIQGLYPPGSIFKIITAIAGLEEGKITPDSRFFCGGSYRFGNRVYQCWKKSGHGRLNLYEAIEQSCDIYFYQVGRLVGVDSLAYYAKLFGLGSPTRFILKNEKAGVVPTRKWKKETLKTPWQGGETLLTAIGQSFILVTPLQILVLISAIANNGKIYLPQLVKKVEDNHGKAIKVFQPKCVSHIPVSLKSFGVIKEALRRVVQSPYGTGRVARIKGVELAGKTGTAQVVGLPFCKKNSEVPYNFRDHAWFIAFAPFKEPKIALVVLVEHGGYGSSAAGPVAKKVINYYLKKFKDARLFKEKNHQLPSFVD